MPPEDLRLSIHDLVAAWRAGQATISAEQAFPVVGVSRSAWYRFLKSPDAPPGLCLTLGRSKRISIPVLARWLSVDLDAGGRE